MLHLLLGAFVPKNNCAIRYNSGLEWKRSPVVKNPSCFSNWWKLSSILKYFIHQTEPILARYIHQNQPQIFQPISKELGESFFLFIMGVIRASSIVTKDNHIGHWHWSRRERRWQRGYLKSLANRSRQGGIRDDLPLMPSLSELNIMTETHNRTMFSVVDDLDTAHTLVGAT